MMNLQCFRAQSLLAKLMLTGTFVNPSFIWARDITPSLCLLNATNRIMYTSHSVMLVLTFHSVLDSDVMFGIL